MAVVAANVIRVTLALALVVISGFTLGAKVCVAPGPLPTTASLVLATAGVTVVAVVGSKPAAAVVGAGVVLVSLVAASVSPSFAEMLLRRKPEEEKRRHDCKQTGHVKVQCVKFCHLVVRF